MSESEVLQWNLDFPNKGSAKSQSTINSRKDVLSALLSEYDPTLVALQEADNTGIKEVLRKDYQFERSGGIITAYKSNRLYDPSELTKTNNMLLLEFREIDNYERRLLVCNVHLRSRTYSERGEREDIGTKVVREFKSYRSDDYSNEEIILGDFNENPYVKVILKETGFFGRRNLFQVKDKTKRSTPPDRPLYNPTWHIFGKRSGAIGTYYNPGSAIEAPWYLFDQILLSPEIAVCEDDSVQVVSEVQGHDLVGKSPRCKPDRSVGSDHLPVVTKLNL
jgi:endonuclease/exonuclease/phosphatase family metal-dependent hydrolase